MAEEVKNLTIGKVLKAEVLPEVIMRILCIVALRVR